MKEIKKNRALICALIVELIGCIAAYCSDQIVNISLRYIYFNKLLLPAVCRWNILD